MRLPIRSFSVVARLSGFAAALIYCSVLGAQTLPQVPLLKEGTTVKVSEHVWVIPDGNVGAVPNVGIIVGSRATLIVDTGLGIPNGEIVLREVAKLSRNTEVYVATTHYHPEHTTGGVAFPASFKFVRPQSQQEDIREFGARNFKGFAARSPEWAALMKDSSYPPADILFERDYALDLGGVRVQLTWLGPTHTRGDTAIFVEGENVLFSGEPGNEAVVPGIFESVRR